MTKERSQEIDNICAEVARYWKKYPDYRFWQLMVNVSGEADRDIWFIDDEDCLDLFEKHFKGSIKDVVVD